MGRYVSTYMSSITEPLQLIHMDLFGPVNVMSMSRKKYALVMVDDISKYTWVLFLHSKDEAPQLIIDHIKQIEVEAKLLIREIRTNNGTKLRQYSAPRTPQQN